MNLRRNTEGRWAEFWAIVDRASEEAKSYPYWKRGASVAPPEPDAASLDAARRRKGSE